MTTYSFDTITPEQAMAITSQDQLVFTSGTARNVGVAYQQPDGVTTLEIDVTYGARTVAFGPALAAATLAHPAGFPDGSVLVVGDGASNSVDPYSQQANTTPDAFFGGLGDDTLNAGGGDNLLQGNQGADRLTAGSGNDVAFGGRDNDFISVGDGHNFAQGNLGNDTIQSGADASTLLGGQGDDKIYADGGSNYIDGNLGNDSIGAGGAGSNTLLGEAGDDYIGGGDGPDTIDGGSGDNEIHAGGGDDLITAGDGVDLIYGGAGANTINAGGGDDRIVLQGTNAVQAGAGADTVTETGLGGPNVIDGGDGADSLQGFNPHDTLQGGAGDDTILVWSTSEVVDGGAGSDIFKVNVGSTAQDQVTHILDWEGLDHIQWINGSLQPPSAATYHEGVAASYADALSQMPGLEQQGFHTVALQVGADVLVLEGTSSTAGGVDHAVLLVGRSLADVDFSSFG